MAINPRIKQKAEDIRKKIFGTEVRESLASGIEAISEDVEATIGRQDYVEEQFQDVLDETTGKDVISAPELIAARNGKSNLKTRLDEEHAQVTAQLQQTATKEEVNLLIGGISDGTPLFADDISGMTDTSRLYVNTTDGLVYVYNGSEFISTGVNYQATGLSDKSVGIEKISFTEPGNNLFDKNKVTVGRYIAYTDGISKVNSSHSHSDYIRVNPSFTYTISLDKFDIDVLNTYIDQLAFYDENKVYISGLAKAKSFIVPANAAFVRIPFRSIYTNHLMLTIGKINLPFKTFGDKITRDALSNVAEKTSLSHNLFNKDVVFSGRYISYTNGVFVANAGYDASDYIPVSSGETIRKNNNEQFAFFNMALDYVSGQATGTEFTVPDGADFLVCSLRKTERDTFMITKGAESKPFDTFGYKIPSDIIPVLESTIDTQLRVVSKNGKYKTISSAVSSLITSNDNRGVILIMPGRYKESVRIKQKHIDLIGLNKEQCIVYNTTNDYVNPPIDMASDNNTIQNLTVISDFDENTNLVADHLFAYAVHMDVALESTGGKSAIRNCILKSTINREALGMGSWNGSDIMIEDTVIESNLSYAMYAHNMQLAGGSNQKIKFKNVEFITNADKEAVYIKDANTNGGAGDSTETIVEFINCLAYSTVRGKTNVIKVDTPLSQGSLSGHIKLDGKSFGNNVSELNS